MSDIVEKARTARTNLAEALSLLQSPAAGSLIDSVAEPVAKAMGALHLIESQAGVGVAVHAPRARDAVRQALATLQTATQTPTSERVTEIIAGSLGILHGLAQYEESVAPPEPQHVREAVAPTTTAAVADTERQTALGRTQLSTEPAYPAATPAPAAPSGALDATMPLQSRAPEIVAPDDLVATRASLHSPAERHSAPPPEEPQPRAEPHISKYDSKHASMPPDAPAEGAVRIEANLGAHSPTNFYKGLSGNDVVDDGGLFVATYAIPQLGAALQIVVNMPGGYDFQALAVVKWTRESGAGDAPPGFGCAFTNISSEARQLIYRYVRNREPLFHDDF